MRWVREFLLFPQEHGGCTFEQTLDLFLADVRRARGRQPHRGYGIIKPGSVKVEIAGELAQHPEAVLSRQTSGRFSANDLDGFRRII